MPAYNNLSEFELLKRLQSGDELAFTEIYSRYWEKLLAIAYYFSKDKYKAEDIVHDVMMSLWYRRGTVTIKTIESYLATAVKFAIFKSIAKEKRQNAILGEQTTQVDHIEIESRLDAKFMEEYLRARIEKLPLNAKLVFQYSREEKLTIKEIAGKMDLSPKAVEYHLTRALKALKKSISRIKFFFV